MAFFEAETLTVDHDGKTALVKIDVPGRSVNVVTPQLLRDLEAAFDRVSNVPAIRVLVIRGMKKTGFLAGADLQHFSGIQTAEQASALSGIGQRLFDKLELLPLATLAVIHGPCLGGGLELALACDYRLVVDGPGTQLGLPEVELGLLPAWGGTQRLPRVVGLENSLRIILGGKRLNAREAYTWGLADAMARTENELRGQLEKLIERARSRGKVLRRGLPLRTWRQRFYEWLGIGRRLIFRGARKQLERRSWDDLLSPWEALESVCIGIRNGREAGFAAERAAAGRLAMSPASRNLIRLFLEREKARKPRGGEEMKSPIKRVGIVGAGVMGAGIAQLAVLRGCEVIVQEANVDALGKGVLRIEELLTKAVLRGILSPEEARKKVAAIKGTVEWAGFRDVELVVEAAVEDLDAKRAIFRELENHVLPSAVLATNTSSLLVGKLQEGLKYPERVAGLYFFNPVHKMDLVEVVRAPATDDATTDLLVRWALALGKTPVRVKDGPGFIVNRVLMPYLNEAVQLVAEGLSADQVDGVMRKFGMPMGPLEVLDQVGLDVAAHIADAMTPTLGARVTPNPAFRRLSESGWLGHKTGVGFYRYRGEKKRPNKDALPLIRVDPPPQAAVLKALPAAVRLSQARERLVLLMVNEAAAVLGEGLAEDAQTIDLAMVLGSGWAPHRGGPLHYADHVGLAKVVETLGDFARRYGGQHEACPELKKRASERRAFFP